MSALASDGLGTYSVNVENSCFPYRLVRRGRGTGTGALGLVLLSAGCAASQGSYTAVTELAVEPAAVRPRPARTAPEVHHVLQPGQTLWRLARAYGVSLDELMRANHIDDPDTLEVGQSAYIPGATTLLDVPPYPAPLGAAGTEAGEAGRDTASRADWLWPVKGGEILSYFGAPRRGHRHTGIDIRGRQGQAVRATRNGRVVYSGSGMRGYGKTVIIEHADGTRSLYAHGSALLVRAGQRVERGQTVARIGRSGNASTEHCHFEIRDGNGPIDPMGYLASGDLP